MNITYRNPYGKPITETQVLLMEEYQKVFYVNGKVKTIEEHFAKQISFIQYKSDNETHQELKDLNPGIGTTVVESEVVGGVYKLENQFHYKNTGTFGSKSYH